MILFNNGLGIGTGYKFDIPPYNPLDVIHNLECFIDEKYSECKIMIPWYKNF
jgi:DNA gyrase/topoisomerase IV subunit A